MSELDRESGELLETWFTRSRELRTRPTEGDDDKALVVRELEELQRDITATKPPRDVRHLTSHERATDPRLHKRRPPTQWMAGILQNTTWGLNLHNRPCDEGVDIARRVGFPQLGPYLALTWRSRGLASSKTNDYIAANSAFEEARERLSEYRRSAEYRNAQRRRVHPLLDMHREAAEQVALGASGTAVRVVEHLLHEWCYLSGSLDRDQHGLSWVRAYRALRQGIAEGESAADQAEELIQEIEPRRERGLSGSSIEDDEKLVDNLDILVQNSWIRRPGVMAARCHILAVPLCMMLEQFGAMHPQRERDWSGALADHMSGFVHYFRLATEAPTAPECTQKPDRVFQREIAQLRFTFALLFPGLALDGTTPVVGFKGFDEQVSSLRRHVAGALSAQPSRYLRPDLAFVPSLSAPVPSLPILGDWLQDRRWDANIICSVTADLFVEQIERLNPIRRYVDVIRSHPGLVRTDAREHVSAWDSDLRIAIARYAATITAQDDTTT
jgi:hypothetical protein